MKYNTDRQMKTKGIVLCFLLKPFIDVWMLPCVWKNMPNHDVSIAILTPEEIWVPQADPAENSHQISSGLLLLTSLPTAVIVL